MLFGVGFVAGEGGGKPEQEDSRFPPVVKW